MKFPQCVYNDESVKGFENCEYKIVHSLEEFLSLPITWGRSQRQELEQEGLSKIEVPLQNEPVCSPEEIEAPRKRGRPPKNRD